VDEVAAARLVLVSELGVDEERVDATDPERWPRLALEHSLWDSAQPEFTAVDVARLVGLDSETVRRWWMRLGLPDPAERVEFRRVELELFRAGAAAVAYFGDDAIEHFIVMLGLSARRISEAATAMVVGQVADQPARTLPEAVEASAATASLFRLIPDLVLPAVLLRGLEAASSSALEQAQSGSRVCVGFCDLVASTELLNAPDPAPAMDALAAFEIVANDLAVHHRGRVVKFVGDEVMYATTSAADAVSIGRALLEWVGTHPTLGTARVGIAIGDVVQRDGDLFGPTVNRAARLAAAAEINTALVDAPLTTEGIAQTITLRGFSGPVAIRTLKQPQA
jgi:adenylate cyclase